MAGIDSGLIDNMTTFAVQIVSYGFELTSTILGYLVDNYSTTLAGILVLGLILVAVAKAMPNKSGIASKLGL